MRPHVGDAMGSLTTSCKQCYGSTRDAGMSTTITASDPRRAIELYAHIMQQKGVTWSPSSTSQNSSKLVLVKYNEKNNDIDLELTRRLYRK